MKIYQVEQLQTYETGSDWTVNYRIETQIEATFMTRELAEQFVERLSKRSKADLRIREVEILESLPTED